MLYDDRLFLGSQSAQNGVQIWLGLGNAVSLFPIGKYSGDAGLAGVEQARDARGLLHADSVTIPRWPGQMVANRDQWGLARASPPPIVRAMIADFLKRLMQPEPDEFDTMDAQLALTALLVRLARADGYYAADEIIRIEKIAMARYGLAKDAAAELRSQAENVEAEAPDTVRFTRAIKEAVPYEERVGVIEALWQVALADGTRDQDEDALVRLVSSLLGVSDVDSALARQRVNGTG